MKKILRILILTFIAFSAFVRCKPENNNSQLSQKCFSRKQKSPELNPDEENIKATINTLLVNAGNYNIPALDSMMSDKAMLGISIFRDGTWSNSEIAINDFFESVKK